MALALFAAVATAQRYTGDFCPFLIGAAAFGLAALETASARAGAILRSCVVLLTLSAIAVTTALTVHYQRDYLWGISESAQIEYQHFRARVNVFFGMQKKS